MGNRGLLELLIRVPVTHRQGPSRVGFGMLCIAGIAILAACSQSPDQTALETALPSTSNTPVRPNIIFLLTDDQRADTLSIAGNVDIETPNIDQLARDGVRYSNAFTVQPICAPSRFAFLSGQYERTSGLGFNSPYEVSQAQWMQTYPALLRQTGYHTGFIGKFGIQYYSFDGGAAAQFDYWRAHDGWLPFFPKDIEGNPATEIYRDARNDITTEIMGEYITEFLASRPTDVPFNLSVSFSAPHNSVVSSMYPEGTAKNCDNYACRVMGYPANANPRLQGHPIYDTRYRDPGIEISPDTGEDPHQFIPEGVIDHEARQKWYAYNYVPDLQPEHLIRYYQTITGIDKVVGDLLTQLERSGIADNTIIVFSSDHGLLNGEYGTGGKGLLYDLVAKIPLVVYDPRNAKAGAARENTDLVLSIDVPATMLAYAGVTIPAGMQGKDLNAGITPRDEVFLESLTVAEGNPFIEALRTDEWKYVRYLQPQGCPYIEAHLDLAGQPPIFEQLFHLASDPQERNNLADNASHFAVLEDFRRRVNQRSAALTQDSRKYKTSMDVPLRPTEGAYCW